MLYKDKQDKLLRCILQLRNHMTMLETLDKKPDKDGRIRCGYNIVGTETGRLSCYESPTGSGFNLQTVTKKHRKHFLADEGCELFGCDLAGADGWTVAAWCAYLGDRTMLDDYLFGLKPARNSALMYLKGAEVTRMTREQLKLMGKEIKGDGWLYFANKRVQHGSNYGMKERTVSDTILKDSYKFTGTPTWVPPQTTRQLQMLYFIRYGAVRQWHTFIERIINRQGYLESASGHRRIVFGRRDDNSTIQSLLSNEPQENTTFATNLAMYRLWTDPDNRTVEGRLKIEPIHQVHDALYGQYEASLREWARVKIRTYFDNPITIANQQITIPFEGHYGPAWEVWKGDI
jgi:hypothetical protein